MTKLLSCRYNMDTNRVEARFTDGAAAGRVQLSAIATDYDYRLIQQ